MSLTMDQLSDRKAVFDELIQKYPDLKPYADKLRPGRSITENSLEDFGPTPHNLLKGTQPQRPRAGANTEPTYTVVFGKEERNPPLFDGKDDFVRALKYSASCYVTLYIAWEVAGGTEEIPYPIAHIRFS